MADEDLVPLLGRALDQTGAIIAAISPDQSELPTPCGDWNVRALVSHLIGQDLRNFLISVRGAVADWQAQPDPVGADWATMFQDRARELISTWQSADLNQLVGIPGGQQVPLRSRADQQVAELATHGWDLTVATGQTAALDDALAEHALAWSHQMLRPEHRGPGKAFGLEVQVPPDAPAYDRLAGWFGRDPQWQAPTSS
jgi:uncharacterized protein (TIGR03086 family)